MQVDRGRVARSAVLKGRALGRIMAEHERNQVFRGIDMIESVI